MELLLKETDPRAAVSCIGPAGENVVDCAVIVSESFSAAGKNGAGAVMGSKHLKAVVACGTEGLRMADQAKFLKSAMELRSFMKSRAIAIKGAREHDSVLMADNLVVGTHSHGSQTCQDSRLFWLRDFLFIFCSFSDGEKGFPLLAGTLIASSSERLRILVIR